MKITLIILLFLCSSGFAQQRYILYEESTTTDSTTLLPFKIKHNSVTLTKNTSDKAEFNIINLYFSKTNFRAARLDTKVFAKASLNYKNIDNDVLITFTPIYDSLKLPIRKLKNDEIQKFSIIENAELLQTAIKNLYRCFTENEIGRDDIPGVIKTFKYGLIIKKSNHYYLINCKVLTEYYIIDKENYLFPNQYHYGEINVNSKNETQFFNGQSIKDILLRIASGTNNNNYPVKTIARRIFLSSVELNNNYDIYTYWTYPTYLASIPGIGKFQFIEGIGIINGTYGPYFNKDFLIDLENKDYIEDFNGVFKMELKTINGVSLTQLNTQ